MILIKIMAYIMIVLGVVFTILAVYVTITVESWLDIVIGLFVLGPVSLFVGILVLRKLKSSDNLEVLKKISQK